MINRPTFKSTTYIDVRHFRKKAIGSSVFLLVSMGFLCVVMFKQGTEDKILQVFVLRGKPFLLFYD
jgi:hypothetical protein